MPISPGAKNEEAAKIMGWECVAEEGWNTSGRMHNCRH
jgi:hypothetical protein